MAYAKIPLNFDAMAGAYRDNQSLPPDVGLWLKTQNDYEKKENIKRASEGKTPLHISTSCCMQVSLSFNATPKRIPKAGR